MKPSAQIAISILGKLLDASGAASLAYWTTPNVILTLGGARAYCDSVFWDSYDNQQVDSWIDEIDSSLKLLQHHWALTVAGTKLNEGRPGQKYASFDLISAAGLQQVITQTKLLDNGILEVLLEQKSLDGLLKEMTRRLREQNQLKAFNNENIDHVAFGILLGYPDEAIVGSAIVWQEDDPLEEPLIDAAIHGARYYTCPQPVYSYPRKLMSSVAITEHEQLWSRILKCYYTSEFHRGLEENAEFKQKLKELGNLRL